MSQVVSFATFYGKMFWWDLNFVKLYIWMFVKTLSCNTVEELFYKALLCSNNRITDFVNKGQGIKISSPEEIKIIYSSVDLTHRIATKQRTSMELHNYRTVKFLNHIVVTRES